MSNYDFFCDIGTAFSRRATREERRNAILRLLVVVGGTILLALWLGPEGIRHPAAWKIMKWRP